MKKTMQMHSAMQEIASWPFNVHDIKLWFSLVESKMQFVGNKKQWSKRQVLVQLIPPEYHTDFKQYLQMQELEAGASPYFDIKQVKPSFTTYQPQIKYFCALSKIEEKLTKNNKTF